MSAARTKRTDEQRATTPYPFSRTSTRADTHHYASSGGALVGHLAAFEMTSVAPMSRYSPALRRLGVDERAAEFYDVHVVADEGHEKIAADELLVGLAESDPKAALDVLFGVSALLLVEGRFTSHLLDI